jgi:CRISPR-associated protein Cas4
MEFSVWEVYQYFYCPRKLYFIRKLGLYPPERKKMALAQEQHGREPRRSRRRRAVFGFPEEEIAAIMHDVALEDPELGLYGRADLVLRLRTGELVPVEVKYSDFAAVSRAWRKQAAAYAVLVERKFGVAVRRARIYVLPARRVLEVKLTAEEKRELRRDLERMRGLVESDRVPRGVSRERCGYCEVEKFCRRL